jgi:hypothetical protein
MRPIVAIIGCLLLLFLILLLVSYRRPVQVIEHIQQTQKTQQKQIRIVKAVEHNPFLEPAKVVYEREEDPLLYIDDGTYYRQPIMIEGNRVWVEDKRPQINDLEWGQPLYTDRWANGLYNGSYKTYSA